MSKKEENETGSSRFVWLESLYKLDKRESLGEFLLCRESVTREFILL